MINKKINFEWKIFVLSVLVCKNTPVGLKPTLLDKILEKDHICSMESGMAQTLEQFYAMQIFG